MRNTLLRLQKPLMLMLTPMPLHLMLCSLWLPGRMLLWAVTPLMYLLLASLCLLPPAKHRVKCGVLSAIGIMAAALLLLPWREYPGLLVTPVSYTVLLLMFLKMGGWSAGMELPPHPPILAAVLYLIIQFLYGANPELYPGMLWPFRVSFLLWFLLLLLYMNRLSLQQAVLDGRHKAPELLRRRNTLLVGLIYGLTLLISVLPALGQALNRLWQWVTRGIIWLMALISSLFARQAVSNTGGAADPGELGFMEAAQPSAFARFMEKVAMVFAAVVGVVLLFLLLRTIWRRLRVLLRRLMERMREYSLSTGTDYEDEAQDTRDDQSRDAARRQLRRVRSGPEAGHTPADRIRASLRQIRQADRGWQDAHTARDRLPEEKAAVYEQARYSLHEVTGEQADAFQSFARKKVREIKRNGSR